MEERFESAQPKLLGAMLDLFVKVLAKLPSVSIAPEHRPRMADFAALGEAVFRVHGEPAGAFLIRYNDMRKDGVLRTIDASPVGAALVAYLAEVPSFDCTLKDLLGRLDRYRPHGEAWPRSPKGLGDALRRLAPALRMIGFVCKQGEKTGGAIRWSIFPGEKLPAPSPASPGRADQADRKAGHAGHAGHAPSNYSPGKSCGQVFGEEAEAF